MLNYRFSAAWDSVIVQWIYLYSRNTVWFSFCIALKIECLVVCSSLNQMAVGVVLCALIIFWFTATLTLSYAFLIRFRNSSLCLEDEYGLSASPEMFQLSDSFTILPRSIVAILTVLSARHSCWTVTLLIAPLSAGWMCVTLSFSNRVDGFSYF